MILRAPAKINLYLRVFGKRRDGYHDIETIFERIALFDRIVLNSLKNGRVSIFCDNPAVPTGKKSLIRRTIDCLKTEGNGEKGVEIKIFKKIPIAAGLGGGSSDAASILKGLKKLWRLPVSRERLTELGKGLGSDIPFFLKDCSFASGGGRGDEIKKLARKNRFWHLIVCPPVRLLSGDIYKKWDSQKALINSTKRHFRLSGVSSEFPYFFNDLEKSVFKKAPVVNKLKKIFAGIGTGYSLVSGSGPSIFSLFENRKEAIQAKRALIRRFPAVKSNGWQIFTVSTL